MKQKKNEERRLEVRERILSTLYMKTVFSFGFKTGHLKMEKNMQRRF